MTNRTTTNRKQQQLKLSVNVTKSIYQQSGIFSWTLFALFSICLVSVNNQQVVGNSLTGATASTATTATVVAAAASQSSSTPAPEPSSPQSLGQAIEAVLGNIDSSQIDEKTIILAIPNNETSTTTTSTTPAPVKTILVEEKADGSVLSSIVTQQGSHKHSGRSINVTDRLHKFDLFIDPVCEQLARLSTKQLNKVYQQLKQFSSHTSDNQLAKCFKDHGFKFDINQPFVMDRDQLSEFCLARAGNSESFKLFTACAASVWTSAIEIELDSILKDRISQTTSTKVGSTVAGAKDQLSSAERSLIDDIVAHLHDEQVQEIASELALEQRHLAEAAAASATSTSTSTTTTIAPTHKIHQSIVKSGRAVKHLPGRKILIPKSAISPSASTVSLATLKPNQQQQQQQGQAQPRSVQKHRTIKKIPSKLSKNHLLSNPTKSTSNKNGSKEHKYKIVRVIKRKKKLPPGLSALSHSTSHSNTTKLITPASKPIFNAHSHPAAGHAHPVVHLPIRSHGNASLLSHHTIAHNLAAATTSGSVNKIINQTTHKPLQQHSTTTTTTPLPTTTKAAILITTTTTTTTTTSTPKPPVTTTTTPFPIHLDASKQPQSLSVLRDVTFAHPSGHIVNRADLSGIVSSSRFNSSIVPPPVSKEVIEYLSKDRLNRNEVGMKLQNEVEQQRYDLMLQRQVNAARQMRLASRLESNMMRSTDFADRLMESELRRHDDLDKQVRARDKLRDRVDQIQSAFAIWRGRR